MRGIGPFQTGQLSSDLFLTPVVFASDDWEIQEPTVTITRTQFWAAVRSDLGSVASCMSLSGLYGPWRFEDLARKLGLEP